MDLEITLNKISSPEEFSTLLETLKATHLKKINCNILKGLQSVIRINKKDLKQFNGIIVVHKVLNGCLKYEFTDADWLKLHEEFAKSVIVTYECILSYKDTRFMKDDNFSIAILQLSQLIFPIVLKVDSVRSYILNRGHNIIFSLICLNELDFKIRKEIFPLLKPILVKTNIQERKLIVESSGLFLRSMAKLVINCGDYETQEGLVEILMRFSYVSKQKLNIICIWFNNYIHDLSLIKILDYSNFDLSCREFLNTLNSANSSKVKVITLPCLEAYANDVQLKKPIKEEYRELWVDFSIATGIVHLVCESGENVWLKLVISQNNVKRIITSNRVVKGAGAVQFLFELISPLQVITSSLDKYVASLTLIFLQSPKIVELKEHFFYACYKDVFEEEQNKLSLWNSSHLKNSDSRREAGTPCASNCFCGDSSTISSIHPTSVKCIRDRKEKGNSTSFRSSPAQLNSLATSTPKLSSHVSHCIANKENRGFTSTSNTKLISDSKDSSKKSSAQKISNNDTNSKWQKASLIRYNKFPCLAEEDLKFKQMCDERIAMIKTPLSNSDQAESLSQPNKFNQEKVLETKNQQGENLISKTFLDYDIKKSKLLSLNKLENNKDTYESNLKGSSIESKFSEECSPFTLTINKTSKPENYDNNIVSSQQMSLNKTELDNNKQAKNDSTNTPKFENMKTLFKDNKCYNDKFGLQHSNKPSPPLISNSKPSLKKTRNFFLRPSKLQVSKPPDSGVKRDFSSSSNINTNFISTIQNTTKKENDLVGSNKTFTKNIKSVSEGNEISCQSQNLLLSKLENFDKINNYDDINNVPLAKKIKTSETSLKNIENQYKNTSNATCKTKKRLSEIGKNNLEIDNIETNESEKTLPHVAKSSKMCALTLNKIKDSTHKNKSLDVYDWNSSKSYTDNEGNSFTNLKFNRNIKKSFTTDPSNSIAPLRKDNTQMLGRDSQQKIEVTKMDETPRNYLSNHKDSSNVSIHCIIPNKTYGPINTKVNLESSSEKIFENLKRNVNEAKPMKKKLFNPKTDIGGGSFEEECVSKPPVVTKDVENKNSKSIKYKEPETFKDLSPTDCKKPEPNRRRSLRLRPDVKYIEPSTESTSSCGIENIGITGEISRESTKTQSNNSKIMQNKISKSQGSALEKHTNSFLNISQEVEIPERNSNNKTTKLLSINTRKKDSENSDNSGSIIETSTIPNNLNKNRKRKSKHSLSSDNMKERINKLPKKKSTPFNSHQEMDKISKSKLINPVIEVLSDLDDSGINDPTDKVVPEQLNDKIDGGTRNDAKYDSAIGQGSAILEHNLDPLRGESICDLSLQGIPAEEGNNDESELELVNPPLKLSTDNSKNSPSTFAERLQHESSQGTQAEARTELHFLDNIISELDRLSVGNSRKKILTGVVSMDKAIKKMELFTKTSDKDMKNIVLRMKNDMEALVSSYDDFFNKLSTKMTDVISIMTRVSENVTTDQDSRLQLLEDLEKLCKERRNNVIEDKFIYI